MNDCITIQQISKNFGNQKALDHIDLGIKKGEIYGLVGVNGSGKSTLMNILFGNRVISESGGYTGQIRIENRTIAIANTKDAIKNGIGMIHQEFMLIPELSIYESINLNKEKTINQNKQSWLQKISYLDDKENKTLAKKTLKTLGFDIDVSLLVKNLSVNTKQFVEIARAINTDDLKLLLLDEPTAALNTEDSNILMKIIKDLAATGVAILFCSHRLHEVCNLCDKVSVLRDGRLVSTYGHQEMSVELLAKEMIGSEVDQMIREKGCTSEETILTLQDFSVKSPEERIRGLNLAVKKKEIMGITSLSGHGKAALCYGIIGYYPMTGEVFVAGEKKNNTISDSIAKGLFLLPDDRKEMGLMMEESVEYNIVFSSFQLKDKFKKKILKLFSVENMKIIEPYVKKQIAKLNIKCTSQKQKVRELSGGNQQKVCIARAAAMDPKILIVMEPTRGIDIGAKEKILEMIVKMNRDRDMTILVASSEIEELKRICDRIVVLCEGRLSGILDPGASEEEFALALTGELNNE
ncbi:sugar ABC transporter ATP-binding protein [Acetobacterium sp.]|jgi:simple sugar transport system ATP-binding protein|uniref:sugar ABC transporter ATP-binding protein n=1 Tax=Acetobacterium sp. TaxID=1872094 RepID=UPI00271BA398|nr:sugar ABC transporter ATP-binding protein [Acetobacterium sp.]MDO9492206.1 sugar ABC transporter ATP-binding protein [Acetobacterium sp.]